MTESSIPAVRFTHVSRHFSEVRAVDDVSLDIVDGEFFTMLGPSGSGKTTCLRLIAGFEQPTGGSIQLHGAEAAGQPPYERDVNTVFQDYALFPHMTVGENVAYGLRVKGVSKAERTRRAEEALAREGRQQGGPPRPRGGTLGDGAAPGIRRPKADPALGRTASARRAGARDRQ